MSDTGLHAGFYEQVRHYAHDLDTLLIHLKTHSQPPPPEPLRHVASLARDMAAPDPVDPIVQLLAFVARKSGVLPHRQLREMGDHLLTDRVTPTTIAQLERLARFLEEQRAGVSAQMRGR